MSKRAYSAWDYPSNTKQNPIPPAKSSQERNRGVGIPQSQQSTAAKKSFPKPETAIPMDRQLYREALEAQGAAQQNPAAKTPRQSIEKPLDRQEQGYALIFPPEYGTIYPDGKRYPVVVSPYGEAKPIIKQMGLPDTQAHHVAPNAIYRDTIARDDGITISLPGNVLTNPESAHGKAHNHAETRLDGYRALNIRPTNREACEIFLASLQTAGVNKNVAEFSLDWLIRQQMERGIYPKMPIPRMPQKIHFNFKKKNVVEEDAGNAESIQ